jgi:WD40 repeat protein/DNA-binding SARP family transcriptional activator
MDNLSSSALRLHLFGGFRPLLDGEAVNGWRSERARALLAYLAVERDRAHSRQELATLFWPTSNHDAARASLRQTLANLRQVLRPLQNLPGGSPLAIDRHTVHFEAQPPAVSVDLHTFDHLLIGSGLPENPALLHDEKRRAAALEALNLYTGELLAGLVVADSSEFNRWRIVQQETRHRRVLQLLQALGDHALRQGDFAQAAQWAQRELSLEPWREAAHRRLLLALALDNRADGALRQWAACRRILAAELGVEPSLETRDLVAQIRSGQVSSASVAGVIAVPQSGPLPPCPYRGLLTFNSADAPLFFGRQSFVDRLVAAAAKQPLVAVVGPSGVGKSSAVFAGLLPELARQAQVTTPATQRVEIVVRPGALPFLALASALIQAAQPLLPGAERERRAARLAADLRAGRTLLMEELNRRLGFEWDVVGEQSADVNAGSSSSTPANGNCVQPSVRSGSRQLILIIDQLEQLFTLCPDQKTRVVFIAALLQLVQSPGYGWQTSVVLTLRADFMGQALAHRDLADALQSATLYLGTMSRAEMEEVIVLPAQSRGIAFEAGLVQRILHDVGDLAGSLPLLEFALTALWRRQATGPSLTHRAYDEIGRVQGAVAAYAEEVYAGFDASEQPLVRRILLSLVRPGRKTADTARLAARSELGDKGWAIAQRLVEARLLVHGCDPAYPDTVELVHEALIAEWARLARWLEEERDFRLWTMRMVGALDQWRATGRDDGSLLRGAALFEAESWLEREHNQISADLRAFIAASRQLARAREERRLSRHLHELAQAQALADAERRRADTEARLGRHLRSLNLATSARLALGRRDTDLALTLAAAAAGAGRPLPQVELMLAEAAYAPGTRARIAAHDAPVHAVAVNEDGRRALSVAANGSVRLWDMAQYRSIADLKGHTGSVNAVGFLAGIRPDEARALTAGTDGTIRLWDLAAGTMARAFSDGSSPVNCLAVEPDGRFVLAGTADGSITRWEIGSGRPMAHFKGHEGAVLTIAVSADGATALSGAMDRTVIHWDLQTGAALQRLKGHNNTVATLINHQVGHSGPVRGVAFHEDGRRCITVSDDQSVVVWDLAGGKQLVRHRPALVGFLNVAPSGHSNQFWLGALDNRILLFDVESRQILETFHGHEGRVEALAPMPDGRSLLSGAADGTLRIWDTWNGAELRRARYTTSGAALGLSPDGQIAALGGWDGRVSLVDLSSGALLDAHAIHTEMVYGGIHFLPDGQEIVSAAGEVFGRSGDNDIRIWDRSSGKVRLTLAGHEELIWDIALSPDGRLLASGSRDGTLRIWDLVEGRGRVLYRAHPQGVRTVAFSPDGTSCLIGLSKEQCDEPTYDLRQVDLTDGSVLRRFAGHHEAVLNAVFCPAGDRVLSSSLDGSIVLWDVATGSHIHRLAQRAAHTFCLVFSPDGHLAATAGNEGDILVWEVASGRLLRRLSSHRSPVTGLVFRSGGQELVSVDITEGLRRWRLDLTSASVDTWLRNNRYLAEMTPNQRSHYSLDVDQLVDHPDD